MPHTIKLSESALAALLFGLHATEMRGCARFLRFPDRAHTLAAIGRLASTCRRLGVTRDQALAALDPIETSGTLVGRNTLVLLPRPSRPTGSPTPSSAPHSSAPPSPTTSVPSAAGWTRPRTSLPTTTPDLAP